MGEIKIVNLTKKFSDTIAVNNLNLKINNKELVALLGPSGCGKTTILRMIAGLIECTTGDIHVDRQSILRIPPEKRNIGMVFQRYVLFPHMTVAGNVGFGLKMRKYNRSRIQKEVERVLEIVKMGGMEERYPHELSGGQQQRIAIARVLIIKPKILLMDEPLANLDAKLREEMRIFIRKLQKKLEITTIFVTHDQLEAAVLADHIAVMFDGVLYQFGTPQEIFTNPRNRKVAKFTGHNNFIDAIYQGENYFKTQVGNIISTHHTNGIKEGEKVTLAIRPENIKINLARIDTNNCFIFKVMESIFQGDITRYRLINNNLYLEALQNIEEKIENKKEIYVSIDPDKVVVLNK